MTHRCIQCRAPLAPAGYRRGQPYCCPVCSTTQPIPAEAQQALSLRSELDKGEQQLAARRFSEAEKTFRRLKRDHPGSADVLVGLLLSCCRAAAPEALAKCPVPPELFNDMLIEEILALDDKRGEQILLACERSRALFAGRVRRVLLWALGLIAAQAALCALMYLALPKGMLKWAEARLQDGDYPGAYLLGVQIADWDPVSDGRQAEAQQLLERIVLAASAEGDTAADESGFALLRGGAVTAVGRHSPVLKDLFPGFTAVQIALRDGVVYAVSADGRVLRRDLNEPGGTPEAVHPADWPAAESLRDERIGGGMHHAL